MTNSIVLRSYVSRRLSAAGRALIRHGRVPFQHASHSTSWRDDDQGPSAVRRPGGPWLHGAVPRPGVQRTAARRAAALRGAAAADAAPGGDASAPQRNAVIDLCVDGP